MSDRMDDLLARLPGEPYPAQLVPAIEARLRTERRRSLWAGRVSSMAALAAAGIGAWLIAPTVLGLQVSAPGISVEEISVGLSSVVASPAGAVWQGLGSTLEWMGRSLGSMGSGMLFALALLAGPACWGAIHLLSEEGRKQGWKG